MPSDRTSPSASPASAASGAAPENAAPEESASPEDLSPEDMSNEEVSHEDRVHETQPVKTLRGPYRQLRSSVRGLAPSATVAMNERVNRLRDQRAHIYGLGFGQSPFPVPEPVVAALREHAHKKDYLPVRGLPQLREAVAKHHRSVSGVDCEAGDVMIGPGSKELMFHLQLAYDGELLLPTPSWVSYLPQARILGSPVHLLPTRAEDDWRLDPAELERVCRGSARARVLVLNDPSNPTGIYHSEDRLRELATVARDHRLMVLSDEIYGLLHHRRAAPSMTTFYPEGTVLSSGLSKWCGAGGWRLGVFVFPRELRWLLDAMATLASETFTTTSAPIQYAAVRAYQGGEEIELFLERSRLILDALGRWAASRLEKTGVEVVPPRGGFYLFPDFGPFRAELESNGIDTSEALCERLLHATGVALLPGSVFGRPAQELTARLAYVDFDGARALEAVAEAPPARPLDDEFLREYCGPTVAGVERLCAWLES